MYMGRFPITNGVQRAYSWSQSKKFQHFTCRKVKRTSHILVKMTVCFLANFSKTAERKKNAIYRDSSTAQAKFKSTNRSKIGSLYEEILQHRCTVPNAQIDIFRVLFLYYNQ